MKPEGYQPAIFEEQPLEKRKTPMVILVSRSTLLAAIRDAGIDVPSNAEVTFRVPGGGDYSSTDVALDDREQVISVRYEK